MNLIYQNHLGEQLDLSNFPYLLTSTNSFNFEWGYDAVETGNIGSSIKRFYRNIKTTEAELAISAINRDDFAEAVDTFFSVTERDVVDNIPGKLITENGEYLTCFIVSADHSTLNPIINLNERKVKILSPYPFWIKDSTKSFRPQAEHEGDFLDYPHDYPYDYTADASGLASWNLNHYSSCDFIMTIFGYVDQPRILINGNEVLVYTELSAHDYLQIDTRNKTIKKFLSSGEVINVFDLRGKTSDIFKKMDGGRNVITWSGSFGFDITAYVERSEPRW